MPALKGEGEWPRKEFLYWTDTGNIAALRYNDWKVTFPRQNAHGLQVWQEPLEELGAPVLCNLRTDPFERAEYESADYGRWYVDHLFVLAPAGHTSGNGCKASANSRRARNPAASILTASWKR
jgi:arylsulfatase A-like enzyme